MLSTIVFLGSRDKEGLQRDLRKATSISVKGPEVTLVKRKEKALKDTLITSRL